MAVCPLACGSDGSGELSFEELKELLPVVDMAPKDDAEVGIT
jgi:hypothetical protein